jgi:hypothetical protein
LHPHAGFFSAVLERPSDASNPAILKVRARVRDHLVALQKRFPELIGDLAIIESNATDYRFRILVPSPSWVQVVAGLASDCEYTNMKGEAERIHGPGSAYVHALHQVWAVMMALQNQARRPGRGRHTGFGRLPGDHR